MTKFWLIFGGFMLAGGMLFNPNSNAIMWVSEPGSGIFSIAIMAICFVFVLAGAYRIVWQMVKGSTVFKILSAIFLAVLMIILMALYEGGHLTFDFTVATWISIGLFALFSAVAWHVSTGGQGTAAVPVAKKGI